MLESRCICWLGFFSRLSLSLSDFCFRFRNAVHPISRPLPVPIGHLTRRVRTPFCSPRSLTIPSHHCSSLLFIIFFHFSCHILPPPLIMIFVFFSCTFVKTKKKVNLACFMVVSMHTCSVR
ncbi:hypothetical protein BC940DRAFT_264071 [Gongronella butleri]|nr:hypothetical protein BC940DRAFT_264071 [Gongronella butleri]